MIRRIRNAEEHRDARAVVADTDALLRVQRQELYERGMSFAQIEEIQHERARLCEEIWEAIVRYENAMCGTVEDITNLEGLGAYLIALRLAKGMSEAELAERIGGYSEFEVCRDEEFEYQGITVGWAKRVLNALGVRVTLHLEYLDDPEGY